MGAKKPKLNIPMCAALVLFLLTMISIHMTSGLYARYTATAFASDSARVAKFDVKVNSEMVIADVTALIPGKLTFTVKNDSEVAVEYSVRINVGSIPDCGVLVRLDSGNELKFEKDTDKIEQEYSKAGQLAVGAAEIEHTVSFEPVDWSKITQNATGESKMIEQSFTVYIDAVQID